MDDGWIDEQMDGWFGGLDGWNNIKKRLKEQKE